MVHQHSNALCVEQGGDTADRGPPGEERRAHTAETGTVWRAQVTDWGGGRSCVAGHTHRRARPQPKLGGLTRKDLYQELYTDFKEQET